MKLLWSGEFYSNFSLAIVNRRLVGALLERGNVDIAICADPVVPHLLSEEFRIFSDLARRDPRGADINIVNSLWPLRFGAPLDARYVRVLPWEYGAMPLEWANELADDVDDIWAPSRYNARIFVNDGVPEDRVYVVPHGVDLRVFNPHGPSFPSDRSRFHFLYVGATIPRKGFDVVVNAYLSAFKPSDRVTLTIKDVNANTFYRGFTHGEQLTNLARSDYIPRLAYVDETYDDAGVAKLYRAVDCLVLPYRGEGFGMPVLEAMACGIPVMVTDGGATDDFVDESVGWRIPAKRRDCAPGSPVPTVGTAWLFEPSVEALASMMRRAYEQRDDVRQRGIAAAERAKAWTWDHAAAIVERRCAQILERAPVAPKRRASRHADPLVFAEERAGSSQLDGILLEIFRRLGVSDPAFAELNQEVAIVLCTTFKHMQWRAVVAGQISAQELSARLVDAGVETELDLLALGYDAGPLWRALDPRPRIVACFARAAEPLARAAADLGYTRLVTEPKRGDTIFIRNDLIDRAGFTLTGPLHEGDVLDVTVGKTAG